MKVFGYTIKTKSKSKSIQEEFEDLNINDNNDNAIHELIVNECNVINNGIDYTATTTTSTIINENFSVRNYDDLDKYGRNITNLRKQLTQDDEFPLQTI